MGDARLTPLVLVLLVVSLANAGVLVHADGVSASAFNFTVEINNDSRWHINGTYYSNPASNRLVLVIGGGALWTEHNRITHGIVGYPSTGVPDDVFMRFYDSGFNVAAIRFGAFISLSALEINTILVYLAAQYCAPTTVSLIGFSTGGLVTAAYLLSEDRWNVSRAVILDAQLETFNSSSLTVPTLLVYGLNDTETPANQSTYAWLKNAPPGMTNMDTYPYEHNPWSQDIDPTTTTTIETQILTHLNGGLPLPEYPCPPILLVASTLILCCIVAKRKAEQDKSN